MSRPTELGHYPFVVIDPDAGARDAVDNALIAGDVALAAMRPGLEVKADYHLERDDPKGPALLAMLRGWPYTVVSVEARDFKRVTDPCLTLMIHNVPWSVTSAPLGEPRGVKDMLQYFLGPPAHAERWWATPVDVMTVSERLRWSVTPMLPITLIPYDYFNVWLMANGARRDMLVMQPYAALFPVVRYGPDGVPVEEAPPHPTRCVTCGGRGTLVDTDRTTGRVVFCPFCRGTGIREEEARR